MTQTVNPGAALARARWDRPNNIARRVDRLAGELETIGAKLTPEQAERLRALIPATKKRRAA